MVLIPAAYGHLREVGGGDIWEPPLQLRGRVPPGFSSPSFPQTIDTSSTQSTTLPLACAPQRASPRMTTTVRRTRMETILSRGLTRTMGAEVSPDRALSLVSTAGPRLLKSKRKGFWSSAVRPRLTMDSSGPVLRLCQGCVCVCCSRLLYGSVHMQLP